MMKITLLKMDHVAVMRKSWELLPKILSGEKIIESRWYKNKAAPWGKIKVDETIYFKNTGEPVTVKAKVKEIKVFSDLNSEETKEILSTYGKMDGLNEDEFGGYYGMFKNKKYCLLIYLSEVKAIEPFEINKTGFGNMAAWISVENIERIKRKTLRTQTDSTRTLLKN